MEFLVIGTAPAKEIVPSAKPYQATLGKRVAEVFAKQVIRHLGSPPPGVRITVERIRYGSRSLYCAVCYYDPADGHAAEYAWRCETDVPTRWDQAARLELARES